jgi:hypothetical protein
MAMVAAVLVLLAGAQPLSEPAAPAGSGPVEDPGPEPASELGMKLPGPARDVAREIDRLAAEQDLQALAVLALRGDGFTASFGEEVTTPEQLVGLWERTGRHEVLRWIRLLVSLPDWHAQDVGGTGTILHITPRLAHEQTAATRSELEQRAGAAEVDARLLDGQWLGWRLGITADGDWRFLVQGD